MRKFSLLFAATLLSVSLSAETITGTSGDLTFNLNTETGVMNFDGDGAMADYEDSMDRPWYNYRYNITSVRFWGNPTAIGDKAFLSCDNLTACNFPSTLTRIGQMAFDGCSDLAGSVSFSYGFTTLGHRAFYNCSKITDFYLPATLTNIGTEAFANCIGVQFFAGNNDNPNYTTAGDVLFNKDKTVLMYYPAAHSRTSYTVPQSVTKIEDWAFYNATNLTEIFLPDQLETIGSDGLENCSALTEITFPASLQSLGDWAMGGCTALTQIVTLATTPPTVGGNYTFYNVPKTIPVYIPAGTLAAYRSAPGWAAFTNIIGNWQCGDNLYATLSADGKTLTIEGTGDMWDYPNFAPWYENRAQITAISLPEGLTSIGDRAFYYFYKVPAITLPSTLQRIGTSGFYHCEALTTIDIPAGVTLIGEDAFVGCYAMTAYTVAATNTAYCAENGVLFTKNKKILIQYPAAKTGNAYEVPYGVEQLALRAIVNENLRSVILPATLQTMGEFALSSSNILQIKTHASFPPIAHNNTFSSIDYSLPLYVPVGTKALYEAATGWLFFTNIIEDASLGIEEVESQESRVQSQKRIVNGQLLIERNGKTYNAQGAEIR